VEEYGFGVFEDWVLRRVFVPEGAGYWVTGVGRKLCNEEFHNCILYQLFLGF
jgi:hypothetical protein